ncbi:MAG: FkbM family methyltransferase [Actinomycetota bacterium]
MTDSSADNLREVDFSTGVSQSPAASTPWSLLAAHVVNGVVIVPGIATVLEMLADSPEPHLGGVDFQSMIRADEAGGFVARVVADNPISLTDAEGSVLASAKPTSEAPSPLAEADLGGGRTVSADEIYGGLDAVGNNYGDALKVISSAVIADSALSAQWGIGADVVEQGGANVLTAAVDGAFHVLGAAAGFDAAFLLGRIELIGFPAGVADVTAAAGTITATNVDRTPSTLTADVDVADEAGNTIAFLRGVHLQRFGAPADTATIGVAATFSTDPLEQITRYWSAEFGNSIALRPAGYGQLFQELLTGGDAFNADADVHVGLVKVDDWMKERETTEIPDEFDTTVLPTGQAVAQLNQYETDYLYNEIFVDTVYARHGIDIGDGATVVDVGANMGMFAMFAASRAKNVKVVAVEPSPVMAPILAANMAAHVHESHLVQAGMAEHNGEAELTFYPKSSVFSTFDPEVETERESILAIVENTVRASGNYSEELVAEVVEEFMADRVEAVAQVCELVSLGEVIDRHNLTEIDLLKVDAEKSERGILRGIRDEDWPKIRQLIVEVHWEEPNGIDDVTELLEAHGYECTSDEENLLVGSGLYTIYAKAKDYQAPASTASAEDAEQLAALAKNVDLFIDAVGSHLGRTNRPSLFVVCPPSEETPAVMAEHRRLTAALSELNTVVLDAQQIIHDYGITELRDPVADRLGHVPYTPDFFAALGTHLVRFLLASTRTPRKLLVLDCDNTVWKGVVGEDGVDGLVIDEPARVVQQLAKDAIGRGMVVALASKNDEAIVREAFAAVPDMILTWDDITAHRINWDSKSQNIRDIATQIGIGSDSAVFLDDSPLECGEVRSRAPEVLTICVEDRDRLDDRFARHLWELDQFGQLTAEDEKRAKMYSEEARRQELQSGSGDFADFIAQLELSIDVQPLGEESVPRAAQMTQRTNQFNTTTVRRTEAEMRSLLAGDAGGTTVKVSDRFGDYGIVGLMTHSVDNPGADGTLTADSFLMSCRALGRGVEHQMIRTLGERASEAGAATVALPYLRSDRNEPVRKFLDGLVTDGVAAFDGDTYTMAADAAAGLVFVPVEPDAVDDGAARNTAAVPVNSERSETIAMTRRTGAAIMELIREQFEKNRPEDTPLAPPENDVQIQLVEVWRKVLGYKTLGIDDNFFEFGGTSLLAVELISAIQATESVPDFKLVDLFDRPTIRRLTGQDEGQRQEESRSRGVQRRQMPARRTRRG